MNIRGVILEGYSNAGKTSVLRAIKQHQSQDESAERSVVVLGEHYSQILNNNHGEYVSLSRNEHLNLLKERVEMLKKLNDWAIHLGPASRRSRGLFFVLKRFHLNHRVAFPEHDDTEIIDIEKQLIELGAKCILLTISDEVVEERIKSRDPDEWLNKSKSDIGRACNELIGTQNNLRYNVTRSIVPTLEINTDNKEWNEYARLIMENNDSA
ncbi:hypothetical protein [Paenibacillus xylanexedens]|uniref:hypothetical protein n=1 Tax=Paenibacillus xylanexedens TaxID=528191 RepID=UPI0011A7CBEA|nr:hypothetical protein [Paenibacillus xylanexedens]